MTSKLSIILFLNLCFWHIGVAAQSKVDELLIEPAKAVITSNSNNFWNQLEVSGRNPDASSASKDTMKLVQDLLNPYRSATNRSEFFDCTAQDGVHALYIAGTYLAEISLSDKPTDSAKQAFRSKFKAYEASCPNDVENGKRFFNKLATTIEGARDERIKNLEFRQRSEIQAKEDIERRKANEKQASIERDAIRAKETEQFRQDRKAKLISGKIKPETIDDVRLMTEAINGVMVVHTPPFKPDMRIYWTWGQLVDWGSDRLLVRWGSDLYLVQTNKSTVFFGETQRTLGKNRPIQVVGFLSQIADTPSGKLPVFQASYISSP
jgi:hypothetical protein